MLRVARIARLQETGRWREQGELRFPDRRHPRKAASLAARRQGRTWRGKLSTDGLRLHGLNDAPHAAHAPGYRTSDSQSTAYLVVRIGYADMRGESGFRPGIVA